MVVAGRRKSVAFFVALGAAMILISLLLYVGWVLLGWRTGILFFLGSLLLALIIIGVVLNTIFLVREIRLNEQQDAFINAVTHELKTPVTSIRLYLETLQMHPVTEEKRHDFYHIMLEDSQRLLASIEQILRTGRAGSAGPKPQLAPLDLGEVVGWCIERAKILHPSLAESLEYRAGPALKILGDQEEVRAAVSNLIDNAVKYSGSNVRVTVETAQADGRFASVRVRDKGAGIPKRELRQIFKRFYRVPGPFLTRVRGTGLGLYIVRSVAKRHGGRAWAESEGPGRGSTFVLELPIFT